ncbi:MAG: B12-binding domain-containing protein [Christensenellales bacterium]
MAESISSWAATFNDYLARFDREGSAAFCLRLLEAGRLNVPQLYEQILAPALNRLLVGRENQHEAIWREHVLSNIVRSIIEQCAPHVLKQAALMPPMAEERRAMLVCPEEEYHDLGVRMGLDFFLMAGFQVTYIGSNTPTSNIISAAEALHPHLIVISVSNYLNLFALEKIIPLLKARIALPVRILVSGSALSRSGREAKDFAADGTVNSFRDILALRGEIA